MKPKLFISFSGGQTSGYMTHKILAERSHKYDIQVVFANTGQENEETLAFVNACNLYWDLDVTWVEAVTHHHDRRGCTHRIVDFETASRNGEPFEDMIRKYGIPNKAYPHCTRELKLNPMTSYIKSLGWTDYYTAVGIRTDEARRRAKNATSKGVSYPLIDWWPTDKSEVNDFWAAMPFGLGLEEHQGNCKWCWKKSFRKHFQLLAENPVQYDFPERMEHEYPTAGHNVDGTPRVFFRQNFSTQRLRAMQAIIGSDYDQMPARPDESDGCSESCDIYAEL